MDGFFVVLSVVRVFPQSPFLDELRSSGCEEPQEMLGVPLRVAGVRSWGAPYFTGKSDLKYKWKCTPMDNAMA